MAPARKLRTYNPSSTVNSSVDAFNLLFATNMTQRLITKKKSKKKKFSVKELPKRTEKTMSMDDSLQVSTEDTFDKLKRGPLYNKVKLVSDNACISSSTDEFVVIKHSSFNLTDSFPMITRSRKKFLNSYKNKSYSLLQRFKDPTVEVLNSIEIEIDAKNHSDSSSYIKIPKDRNINIQSSKNDSNMSYINDCSRMEESFNKIFLEKQPIKCSTPVTSLKIKNNTPVKHIVPLLKQSFEEIKRWEHEFPVTRETNSMSVQFIQNNEVSVGNANDFINLRKRRIFKFEPSFDKNIPKCTAINHVSCLDEFNSLENNPNLESKYQSKSNSSSYNLDNFESFFKNCYDQENAPTDDVLKKEQKSDRKTENDHPSENNFMRQKQRLTPNSIESDYLGICNHSKNVLNSMRKVALLNYTKNSNCNDPVLVVSHPSLEEFETFYSYYMSQIYLTNSEIYDVHNNSNKQEKPQKDIIVNLTKNSHIFEKFYKDHYAEINGEEQHFSDHYEVSTYCKDLIVNITRREDMFEKFYQKYYSIVDNKTNRRGKSETDIIENIITELVVNVSKKNIQQYMFSSISANKSNIKNQESKYSKVTKPTGNSRTNMKCQENKSTFIESDNNTTEFNSTGNVISHLVDSIIENSFNISDHNYNKSSHLLEHEITNDSQNIDFEPNKYLKQQNDSESFIIDGSFEDSHYTCLRASQNNDNISQNRKKLLQKNNHWEKLKLSSICSKIKKKVEPIVLLEVPTSINQTIIDLTNTMDESVINTINTTKESSETTTCNIIDTSVPDSSQTNPNNFNVPMHLRNLPNKVLMLKPGKLWRRSLLMNRRSNLLTEITTEENCISRIGKPCKCKNCSTDTCNLLRRSSIKIVPTPTSRFQKNCKLSLLEKYAGGNSSYVPEQIYEENLENSIRSLSLIDEKSHILDVQTPVTSREVVLRKCGQVDAIPFQECYPESILQNCHKIGEGVYGEVFLLKNPKGGTSVLKIIPIEGNLIVNGEKQKKFDEILSEIIIAMELSNLRYKKSNLTDAFNEVQQVNCVQGSYPGRLLDLWELFEETQGSENDCPEIFPSNQLFIILQLANGGKDLESFVFNNAMQAYAMFEQVAFALAVAETELCFEHRDLHWGNILLTTVEKTKSVLYKLNGKPYEVFTRGVEVAIIDFTLSRIEYDGVVMFNDLMMDEELFTGDGDYQFEIYRSMQKKNRNNWEKFEPYSNLLWLHYILDKAVSALRYKYTQSKIHKEYTAKMNHLYNEILNYKSAKDFVLSYIVAQ